jgi:hypothetical protein
MRRLGPVIVVCGLVCALAPGAAQAGDEPFLVHRTARTHYDRAGKAAERGDLRTAAAELDAAYAIEPHPELLFVRAEVRRRLGECKTALTLYRGFIASAPSEAATKQADDGIKICEESIAASEPKPPPEPEPVVTPPPPLVQNKPVEPARKVPWKKDPAGGVLLGVGVVALAASAGLGGGAAVTAREVRTTDSHEGQLAANRTTNVLLGTSVAAAAVGVGLVIGAALRYRAVKRRSQAGAWFDGHGGGLAWTGRF